MQPKTVLKYAFHVMKDVFFVINKCHYLVTSVASKDLIFIMGTIKYI